MIDVEETTFDLFLRYGLFFGAIFQLVCIGAAIFGPEISETHSKVSGIWIHFNKERLIEMSLNRKRTVKTLDLSMVVQQILGQSLQANTIVGKWTKRREDRNINTEVLTLSMHFYNWYQQTHP